MPQGSPPEVLREVTDGVVVRLFEDAIKSNTVEDRLLRTNTIIRMLELFSRVGTNSLIKETEYYANMVQK